MFPQLLITPFTYKRKDVFQLARPYQLLSAWYETSPDSAGLDEFMMFANELGHYLQHLDAGGNINRSLHEEFKNCLMKVLMKAPHNEILDLARTTLETGYDPCKLTFKGNNGNEVKAISDVFDVSSNKII